MKLILNLLFLFAAFALLRRALRRFFAPEPPRPEVHRERPQGRPNRESGSHPAIGEDEVIEEAEFEELD